MSSSKFITYYMLVFLLNQILYLSYSEWLIQCTSMMNHKFWWINLYKEINWKSKILKKHIFGKVNYRFRLILIFEIKV